MISKRNHKQSIIIYTEFTQRSESIDIFLAVVSQANHDPDFDLAEGSHQVAITLLYLFG